MIELSTLGTAKISTGSAIITPSQEIVFAAALYLILEAGKPVSRARLASLLWPRAAEKVRAHRLRQTLHQLRKLGFQVTGDRNKLENLKQWFRTDTDELGQKVVSIVTQGDSIEFLPGYIPRPEQFRDWVENKRAEIHNRITSALLPELESARRRGDWQAVETIAAACLSLDPYNENAVLARAEAIALRGGKRKALTVLDNYIAEVGTTHAELSLPAVLLRKRVAERIPDRSGFRSPEPPFVGREKEMEQLTEKFRLARKGQGSATLLIGDAGIGKTRLCAELAKFAELQGAHMQRASCRRTQADQPLSLFVDLVPGLRELPGALGCDPNTFATLKRLTEFEKRTTDLYSEHASEFLFENVKSALFDLFDSVVEERTLVILIEDVQWLDSASGDLLIRMVEWGEKKKLLFLLNARKTSEVLVGSTIESFVLGPLTQSASTALLRSMALPADSEAVIRFVRWCLSTAEGNPFFLQELAHHWVETGQRYEVPPSVARILHERLSRLSADALQVLQTSAVLGDHASVERIERVLEFQSHRFLAAIEELSGASMLGEPVEGTEPAAGRLQPRHDLLSSAAVGRLAPISLAFLHRRAADVIEHEVAEETMPTALLWACASHRHHAGDRERALRLSVSCAEHLLDLGLSGDAASGFQRSLEYCTSDEERLRILPRHAVALQMDGRWEAGNAALSRCIALARKSDPGATSHNEYELLLLEAKHQSSFDYSTLLAEIVPCVEATDASPAHRIRAAVMALKIATDFGPEEIIDSLYKHASSFFENEEVSESDRLEVQIVYRTLRARDLVPVEELDRFVSCALRERGNLAHFHALVTAASACRITGRYQQAVEYLDRGISQARAHRFFNRLGPAYLNAVRVHIAAGVFDRAEQALKEARNCTRLGDATWRIESQFLNARIALESGDLARADASFVAIGPVLPTYSTGRRAYYFALGIQLRCGQGAPKSAIEPLVRCLEEIHPMIRGIGGKDFETHSLYLGLCAVGEHAKALKMIRSYVTEHRRSRWPLPRRIDAILHADANESFGGLEQAPNGREPRRHRSALNLTLS